jgi:acyl-CoA synthetase (AMP-forming)/AMP-acid ligase II
VDGVVAQGERGVEVSRQERVSKLVVAGLPNARVMFGPDASHRTTGSQLIDRGAALYSSGADGAAVGILMTNDRPSVEVLLGALAEGARVVSLPLPGRGVEIAEYAALLIQACASHGVASVVVADEFAPLLEDVGVPALRHSDLGDVSLPIADDGFGLVQFTSGSTARPRPIVLTDSQIGANVQAILSVVRPRPSDTLVSWLPLAHDMGLVGMFFTGLAAGGADWAGAGDFVLLDPRQFLGRPSLWLEAISHWRGSFTAAPDFALRLAARRPLPDGADLSSLRCVIVGGEIIRADSLREFTNLFAGNGFDPVALCPAYGMAELGVAATLTPLETDWRELRASNAALADLRVDAPAEGEPLTELVGCGPALPGYDITTADRASPDAVSRISVRGPSLGTDGTTNERFGDGSGWYRTGDIGVVRDDCLYVCGRDDDHVVGRGRNLYAPAIEFAVGAVDGVRTGRVTAVSLPDGRWTIVAERSGSDPLQRRALDDLRVRIQRAAVDAAGVRPDDVMLVAKGGLPLTSSGKLRRQAVRTEVLRGELMVAEPSLT